MNEVEFIYKGKPTIIQCNLEDKLGDLCNKFTTKNDLDINNIYFLYNGDKINLESKFNQINKGKTKLTFLVYDINSSQDLFLKFNLNDYNVKLNFEKNLDIKVEYGKSFNKKIYEGSFSLEELKNKSKFFKMFDLVQDTYNDITILLNQNLFYVQTYGKSITLCIKKTLGIQYDIIFPLKEGIVDFKDIVSELCEKNNDLEKKVNDLEKQINLLMENNLNINRRMDFLEKQIKNNISDEKLNKNEIIKLIENNKEPCSLFDIICKKFGQSKYLIANDFSNHLKEFGLKDNFKNEIENKFETKAKIIYDVKKDGDTLVAFMTKVLGKKNIASFHALHGKEKYLNVQLAYLNGKFEFVQNYFNFKNIDLFTYGNYAVRFEGVDFCFTSFRGQNSRLYVKIELDCIFAIFYEGQNINFIIKIRDNFVNNPILIIDEDIDIIDKFFETHTQDQVGELFKISKISEVNLSELVVYQIGDE